jgi:SAM-dependent methyltransferase
VFIKELYRNCPVCNSSTGMVIHNQSFILVKDSNLPDNYDLVTCTNCGFVFADTSASQDDYNIYYSILSKYEDTSISSGSGFNQNDYDRLFRTGNTLEKYIKKNDSVLDIGCANGGQLNVLKERGFTNLIGVDPSKVCVNNVKACGIEAFQSNIFEQSFIDWEKKFDLIILSHVLEHIRDLGKAIQIAKEKLTNKGIIYIEVPDASRYNEFFIVPYYYIDCEHINHFSKDSLNRLMQQSGFISIETYQGQVKVNDHNDYPYFYSLFGMTNNLKIENNVDTSVLRSINSLLEQSKNNNNSDAIIQKLVVTQEEVIIWGAGQYALRLLASSNLLKANILGFVDSDKSKINKKLGKFEVYSPDFVTGKNVTLLICSALYYDEIIKMALQLNKDIKILILK